MRLPTLFTLPQALILTALLTALLTAGCSTQAQRKPDAATIPTVKKTMPPQSNTYDGTYTNSAGAVLVITDFVANKGFSYGLRIQSKDSCDGVKYADKVKFSAANQATNEAGDSFKLTGKRVGAALDFEPSTEMVGMACIRIFNTTFVRKK